MRDARRSSALKLMLVIVGALTAVVAVRWIGGRDAPTGAAARSVASAEPNFDIYSLDVASGTDRRLTTDPHRDIDPEWSPDGTKIAFARFSDENLHDLYVMDADGSNERILVGGTTDDIKPSWSPNSREIVFMSDRSSFGDLFVVDALTGEVRVKRIAQSPLGAQFPSWSPKGDEIVFVATDAEAGETRIFTVAPDGSDKRVIEVLDGCCRRLPHVEWSPDAQWLLLTWQPKDQADLWLLRSNGQGILRRVTEGTAGEGFASWSTRDEIVFQTNRHTVNGDDLHVIHEDGSGERALVRTPWVDANPDWSPDGDSIAFDSIRGTSSGSN